MYKNEEKWVTPKNSYLQVVKMAEISANQYFLYVGLFLDTEVIS